MTPATLFRTVLFGVFITNAKVFIYYKIKNYQFYRYL